MAISEQLFEWWTRDRPNAIGVYWPIRGEPKLHELYDQLSAAGARLALPVVVGQNQPLQFSAWAPGDALVKDAMGVSIPANEDFSIKPEALLIPCVGFNPHRIRLGYGGGFYDRTLATSPRPITIGVAYSNASVTFDGAPHDIPLDAVVTELRGWNETSPDR